jgi:hypothetical protein
LLSETERQQIAARIVAEVGSNPNPVALARFIEHWDETIDELTKFGEEAELPPEMQAKRPKGGVVGFLSSQQNEKLALSKRELNVLFMAKMSYRWLTDHLPDILRAAELLGARLAWVQTMHYFRKRLDEKTDQLEGLVSLSEWRLPENYREWSQSESDWIDAPMEQFRERVNEIAKRPQPGKPAGRKKSKGKRAQERAKFIKELDEAITSFLKQRRSYTRADIAEAMGINPGGDAISQSFSNKLRVLEVDFGMVERQAVERWKAKQK